jgi:hypothetical protein
LWLFGIKTYELNLIQLLETPYQLKPLINRLKTSEVQEVIDSLNPKKSSSLTKFLKVLPVIFNKIPYPDIQCCLAQRVLPGTMESCIDHPHLEARKTMESCIDHPHLEARKTF